MTERVPAAETVPAAGASVGSAPTVAVPPAVPTSADARRSVPADVPPDPPQTPPPVLDGAAVTAGASNGNSTNGAATANARPISVPSGPAGQEGGDGPLDWYDGWWMHLPSWLSSMVVHLSIVLMLALLTVAHEGGGGGKQDVVAALDDGTGGGNIEELGSQMMQAGDQLEEPQAVASPELTDLSQMAALPNAIGLVRPEGPKGDIDLKPFGGTGGQGSGDSGDGGGNSLGLRMDGALRARMVKEGGGSSQSEEAVKRALHWLSEHQSYDGSWTFEHQKSPRCHGACRDPGFTPGKIAATSLALLPFLGHGETQHEGPYKRHIDLGLRFLVRSMQIQGDIGSLHEQGGQMYGHGLAAIVLCEAYGMTHDQFLAVPAQSAVNFIVEAQDPVGGGWRYVPRQVGDTSVVGWQMMALKSAQMAYLRVPQNTMRKAGYFLDHVQSDRGAVYGYQTPERGRPATTAIGLLCRMYLGWKHDQQALQRGVQVLSSLGPSTDSSRLKNNMYYNYYATQVMHHYGGSEWRRWNEVLREYLIASQATKGHETGSWFLDGSDHGAPAGGRLYCTAMATMTLEVYYRSMPLYRPQSTAQIPGRQ